MLRKGILIKLEHIFRQMKAESTGNSPIQKTHTKTNKINKIKLEGTFRAQGNSSQI